MKQTLQHTFQTKAHDLKSLFTGTVKMSTFMRKLEKQSLIDPNRYDSFKYLGDGFEFFVELFLMLHPCDNRIGVYYYKPTMENDNGCDGTGINIKGEKCVVQIKYRSNTQSFLTNTNDHLANMFSDGMLTHGIVSDNDNHKNYRHFVFTTAESLSFYTDIEMFKGKVKCIGYKDFRSMLDNNLPFWDLALDIVSDLNKK